MMLRKTLTNCFLAASASLLTLATANAQCMADAGPDLDICNGSMTLPITLGGTPIAIGGQPPYTFEWSAPNILNLQGLPIFVYLDDPNIPNPSFTSFAQPAGTVHFVLTVTDANSISCTDTVSVTFNQLIPLDSNDYAKTLIQGDSHQLMHSDFSGTAPFTTLWTPGETLDDPTSPTPWAKPESTTTYQALITDAQGCVGADEYVVTVYATGIQEQAKQQGIFEVYPNPAADEVTVRFSENANFPVVLDVVDLTGRLVLQQTLLSPNERLNTASFPAGHYQLRLHAKSGLLTSPLVISR